MANASVATAAKVFAWAATVPASGTPDDQFVLRMSSPAPGWLFSELPVSIVRNGRSVVVTYAAMATGSFGVPPPMLPLPSVGLGSFPPGRYTADIWFQLSRLGPDGEWLPLPPAPGAPTAWLEATVPFHVAAIRAAPGDPDPGFGVDGTTTGAAGVAAAGLALQPDGKVIVAGAYAPPRDSFPMARYNPDGSPDASFGVNGIADTPGLPGARALVALPYAARFVAGGLSGTPASGMYFTLVRWNSDGLLDTTFGSSGFARVPMGEVGEVVDLNALVAQPDGKVVAAGNGDGAGRGRRFALARFNADGTPDITFAFSGIVKSPVGGGANALVLQADGKLVAGGYSVGPDGVQRFAVVRYLPNGSVDTGFGNAGMAQAAVGTGDAAAHALAIQADGKLVAAGVSTSSATGRKVFTLLRFTSAGALDPSFGNGGIVQTPVSSGDARVNSIVVQPDGKLVAAGTGFSLARYTPGGTPDPTFGSAGLVTTTLRGDAVAIASGPDNLLVAAGTATDAAGLPQVAMTRVFGDSRVWATEYYYAAQDRYFLTAYPWEIAALDANRFPGWIRTGEQVRMYRSGPQGQGDPMPMPVCRFWGVPAYGLDTHWYSAFANECAAVAANWPAQFVAETTDAFRAPLPDVLTGACPAGTVPVYRLYNRKADLNHRYTTSAWLRARMLTQGWVAEGYGPDGVGMCALP